MNRLDIDLLETLVRDARTPGADRARELGIWRAHARGRVQALSKAASSGPSPPSLTRTSWASRCRAPST